MNDEPLLKNRMLKLIEQQTDLKPSLAKSLRNELVDLFNEHSKEHAIIDWEAKDRIRNLERLKYWLEQRREGRDQEIEVQKRERLGDRYKDILQNEIDAIDYALRFVKEHSV